MGSVRWLGLGLCVFVFAAWVLEVSCGFQRALLPTAITSVPCARGHVSSEPRCHLTRHEGFESMSLQCVELHQSNASPQRARDSASFIKGTHAKNSTGGQTCGNELRMTCQRSFSKLMGLLIGMMIDIIWWHQKNTAVANYFPGKVMYYCIYSAYVTTGDCGSTDTELCLAELNDPEIAYSISS